MTVKAPRHPQQTLYGILTLPRELQYARKPTEMPVVRMVLAGEQCSKGVFQTSKRLIFFADVSI